MLVTQEAKTRPIEPESLKSLERFWDKVDRSGGAAACWLWTGSQKPTGYGQVSLKGRVYLAHRVAWTLTHGAIPDGLGVLHHCDNPPCCNPAHLFLGSQGDNSADMVAKDRRRGRPTRYGVRATQRAIYLPPGLKETVEHEARVRNVRDATNAWNFSSVVVDIVARHFGMDFVPQEIVDGR